MKLWAEDFDHGGPPFAWNEDLRAELDAFYARKYGLTREELRYTLDPANVKGSSYPSETFRVLKNGGFPVPGTFSGDRNERPRPTLKPASSFQNVSTGQVVP